MARVTVEDCITLVPNRFELVLLAAQRARDVSSGAPLAVGRDNDKNPVVALREIAGEHLHLDRLREDVVKGLQKHHEADEPEEDVLSVMPTAQELGVAETALGGDLDEDGMVEEAGPVADDLGAGGDDADL